MFETAKTQQDTAKVAYENWLKNKNDTTWEEYHKASDELANTLIQYTFMQGNTKDLTNIAFGGWVSDQKDNNYVLITYEKDGVVQKEYFDYVMDEEDNGRITLVKKSPVYQTDEEKLQLVVTYNNGEASYKLGNQEIDPTYVTGDAETGYTVETEIEVKTEIFTYSPGPAGAIKYNLEAVTKCGVTTYYEKGIDGKRKEVEKVSFDSEGNLIKVGSQKCYNVSSSVISTTEKLKKECTNTGTFAGKGQDYLSEDMFNNGSDGYQQKTNALRDKLTEANKGKEEADQRAQEAANSKEVADQNAAKAKQDALDAAKKQETANTAKENAEKNFQEAAKKKEQADADKKQAEEAVQNAKEEAAQKAKDAEDAAAKAKEAAAKAEASKQEAGKTEGEKKNAEDEYQKLKEDA